MTDLFARVGELRQKLGENGLLDLLDQAEVLATDTEPARRRRRRRPDGRGWGDPIAVVKRIDGQRVRGWEIRPELSDGSRPRIFSPTVAGLADEVEKRKAEIEGRRNRDPEQPANYGEACEEVLAVYDGRESSKKTLVYNLKSSREEFGPRALEQITRHRGQGWLIDLAERGLAPITRFNYLKACRQVLNACVANEWLDKNRLSELTVAYDPAPDPFHSWDEVFVLASRISWQPLGRGVRFAAGQGLRPQEWCVARACDVDLERGLFYVRRTWDDTLRREVEMGKTRGSLTPIGLTELGLEVISETPVSLHRDPDDWRNSPLLFPGPDGQLVDPNSFRRDFWVPAFEGSGIRYRPPKQLRHSFATLTLLHNGLEHMKAVSLMLRHDHVSTTERFYLKIVDDMLKQGAVALSGGMPRYTEFLQAARPRAGGGGPPDPGS
ncbi:MAG: tyrosine-type recombinase/integrase [Gaiellaceae bacterium]